MSTGTVVAVVAANMVALAAIWVGWVQTNSTLKQGRELADLGAVRALLDDAAVDLHKTAYVLDTIRVGLAQFGAGFFSSDENIRAYEELERLGEGLDTLAERLRVRFGKGHSIVVGFNSANDACLHIFRMLKLLREEIEVPPHSPGAAAEVRENFLKMRTRIDKARIEFDDQREAFRDAATNAAGAHLPDQESGS